MCTPFPDQYGKIIFGKWIKYSAIIIADILLTAWKIVHCKILSLEAYYRLHTHNIGCNHTQNLNSQVVCNNKSTEGRN